MLQIYYWDTHLRWLKPLNLVSLQRWTEQGIWNSLYSNSSQSWSSWHVVCLCEPAVVAGPAPSLHLTPVLLRDVQVSRHHEKCQLDWKPTDCQSTFSCINFCLIKKIIIVFLCCKNRHYLKKIKRKKVTANLWIGFDHFPFSPAFLSLYQN